MVEKYVVGITLTDEEIKHSEYSINGQQSWKSLFYSSVKTSSRKHGVAHESAAVTLFRVRTVGGRGGAKSLLPCQFFPCNFKKPLTLPVFSL